MDNMIISKDGAIAQFENGEKVVLPDTSYEWINVSTYADISAGRTILVRGLRKSQSDLEKFIDLYKSVGIEVGRGINREKHEQEHGYQYIDIVLPVFEWALPKGTVIHRYVIYFDESGKFIQQGIWE